MRMSVFLAALLFSLHSARAESELPVDATVDQVLDALDECGKTLTDFTAKVSMKTGNPDVEEPHHPQRHRLVSRRRMMTPELHVIFDTKRTGGGRPIPEKLEYALDKGWLVDRDFGKHTETRRQVVKPGQKINLLKLGEGPFPLPVGQKKEDVHQQFDVSLIPSAGNSDTIHIQLKPKPGTPFFKRFAAIDVLVSRKTHFPVQINTDNPDNTDPRQTKLDQVQVNTPGGLKPDDFKLQQIDPSEWNMHSEAYKE